MILDFESPNSSDARIIEKDVKPFVRWAEKAAPVPYLVITCLPNRPTSNWPLLYCRKEQWYEHHHGQEAEIRKNPFEFWYARYREGLKPAWRELPLHFANFDGAKLSLVSMKLGRPSRLFPLTSARRSFA